MFVTNEDTIAQRVPVADPPRTIFIERSELPEVIADGRWIKADGHFITADNAGVQSSDMQRLAMEHLAVAEFLAAREMEDAAAAALAERVRVSRRYELLREFTGASAVSWDNTTPLAKKLINHIIDMEAER